MYGDDNMEIADDELDRQFVKQIKEIESKMEKALTLQELTELMLDIQEVCENYARKIGNDKVADSCEETLVKYGRRF